jgi:hypothetical protein
MNDEFQLGSYELSRCKNSLDEHDEESYCNWAIKNRPDLLSRSPHSDSCTEKVSYSGDVAKELEERDRELRLQKEARAGILKLLRDVS